MARKAGGVHNLRCVSCLNSRGWGGIFLRCYVCNSCLLVSSLSGIASIGLHQGVGVGGGWGG